MLLRAWSASMLLVVGLGLPGWTQEEPRPIASYDPLKLSTQPLPEPLDRVVQDAKRMREIPLRIYLPPDKDKSPAAVVLFSHGLGGSREGSAYLGRHWAGRGYVAVFVQHPGSDTTVWEKLPPARRMAAMREAASARNFLLRVRDIPVVLDQLSQWEQSEGHPLAGRLDLKRIGMSGHSFGAVTTQAVSGQRTAAGQAVFTDARIKAAVAFSPSSPRQGNADQAFGQVKIPWMLLTGTRDVAIIGDADLESRLAVFPALPPGGKYELVLERAEHSAFSERALPGDKEPRNLNHHKAILAVTTAFWDAWLRDDADARKWLDGDGPRTVLEAKDGWRIK